MGPMDGFNHSSWTARLSLETGSTRVGSPIWFTELLGTIILYLTESLPGRFYLRMLLRGRNPVRRYSTDLAPSSFATAPHPKFEDWESHWLCQKQCIIRMWLPTYVFLMCNVVLGSVLVSPQRWGSLYCINSLLLDKAIRSPWVIHFYCVSTVVQFRAPNTRVKK